MRRIIDLLRSQHHVQAVAAVRLALTVLVAATVAFHFSVIRQQRSAAVDRSLGIVLGLVLVLNLYIFWLSSRRRIDRWLVPLAVVDTLFIGEATFATGGIASPLQVLLLFPIGVVAVTVSMRAALWLGVLAAVCYSLLTLEPIAGASLSFIRLPLSSRQVIERFTVFNVLISDLCYVAFAAAAGWLGDALRRHENVLLERSSRLRGEVLLLSRLAKTTSRHTNLAPIVETVLQVVAVELAAERAGVYLLDPVSGSLAPAAVHGFESDAAATDVLNPAGAAYQSMRERRIVRSSFRGRMRDRRGAPLHAVAAPLMVGTDCLGCLYLDSGAGRHRWRSDSLELIAAISDLTAVAIQNAQLYSAATSEQSKLEASIGAVSDAMLLFDNDGKVLLANRRFLDTFGLPQQVRGMAITSLPALCRERLLPAEVVTEEQTQQVWAQLLEPGEGDVELLSPLRTFQRRIAPVVDEQGQQFASILTLHDVTDERIAALAKDEILASVSHELRTPLTTVKGYTQIFLRRLERGDSRFSASEFQLVLEQIDRLAALVDELLDVSRLPAQRFRGRSPVLTDMRQVVEDVVARAAAREPERRIVLEQPPEPVFGSWNARRVAQALENLLNNAVKFSPSETPVYVRTTNGSNLVTVAIRDHGIGVPGEHAAQIFEPFYRIDNSTTRRTGGLGLGLYVSRLIAEQHGGTLTLESEPGAGSTFCLSLPLE